MAYRERGIAIVWLVAICVGCDRAAPPIMPPKDAANLIRIDDVYRDYLHRHGKPPRGPADVKKLLADRGEADEVFRSPEDGEDYVILWGVDIRAAKVERMPPPVVAYEKTGRHGRRHVLTVMGVQTMTDAEFERADFVAKRPTP